MKVAILTLLFVAAVQGLTEPSKFIVRYAMGKAREACAGERLARVLEDYVQNILTKCKYNGAPPRRQLGFPALPAPPLSPNHLVYPQSPLLFLPGGAVTLGHNHLGLGPNYLNPTFSNALPRGHHNIFKRDTEKKEKQFLNPSTTNIVFEDLLYSEEELKSRISNITCVLINGEVMDANGNLLLDRLAHTFKRFNFQGKLEAELLKGTYECGKFASCMPPTDLRPSLIPFHIKRAVIFLKCLQGKRYEACLRKDIRETVVRNFRNGIRGALDVEQISQRMVDVLMSEELDGFENLLF